MKTNKIVSLLIVLPSLLLIPTLSLHPRDLLPESPVALEGEKTAMIQSRSGESPPQISGFGELKRIEIHQGYDKKTGQYLEDPTIHRNVVLSPEELAALERSYNQKMAEVDPTLLRFRSGYTMHPQPGIDPEVYQRLTVGGGEGYYLIQFSYPFPTKERYRLESLGYKFYDYVGESGMYTRIPSGGLQDLQDIMADGNIRYVGDIPDAAKVAPDLAAQAADRPDSQFDVTVLTFEPVTATQLKQLEGLLQVERRSDGPVNILEGKAPGSSIVALSQMDFIRWIELQHESTLGNLEGSMGMSSDYIRTWLFDGSDIHVMVVDSGIARDGTTYHPDLLAGRILDQYDYQNSDPNAADDDKHGTHVAGSIAGLYNSGDSNSERAWQGVAPGADLLIYKLCCGTNQFSSTWFEQALQRATSDGRTTHISNNSWGGGNGIYDTHSEIADRAVRGEYNNQYINMVIISHNQNDLTTFPGTGKNVITVGSVKDGNYPNIPFTNCGVDEYDWPPGERVCYSNYGPIDTDGDGNTRVKPDLMAPGAMIMSATPWYLSCCDYYGINHGTSMAAPHVSGAIAQIYDAWFEAWPVLLNWPELEKAILLASAVDVGGNSNLYGRGMIDPGRAIYYQGGIQGSPGWWNDSLSNSGDYTDYTFEVPAGYEEVTIVLTWPDPAGANEVDNDLDISSVTDADGTLVGASFSLDDTVEYVKIPPGYTPGTWTVRVSAWSLSSRQSYGLAMYSILIPANLHISTSTDSLAVPGEFVYYHQYVSNGGYTAGGSYAMLYVPDGFTVHGVRIFTLDGFSEFFPTSYLYHVSGSNFWRVAIGNTWAGPPRHVRWLLQADYDNPGGTYTFLNSACWRQEGSLHCSIGTFTDITVPMVYIPVVMR